MTSHMGFRKVLSGKGYVFVQLPGDRSLFIGASSLTLEDTSDYTQIRGDDNRYPSGIVLGDGTAKVTLEHGEMIMDEDWMEALGFESQHNSAAPQSAIKGYNAVVTSGEIDLASQIPAGYSLHDYAVVVHYTKDNVSLRKVASVSKKGEFSVSGTTLSFHADDEGAEVTVHAILTTAAWQWLKDGAFTGACHSLWLIFPSKYLVCNATAAKGDFVIVEVFQAELVPNYRVAGSSDPFTETLVWEVLRRSSDGKLYSITDFGHGY